jgi:acyl carrier protein
MSLLEDLEQIVIAESNADIGKTRLDPDDNLLERGIVDSLGVLKIVSSLESSFGITIMDEDILPENFQSLNCLARMVESKRQAK